MDLVIAQFVRGRAGNRCEYCRLPQNASAFLTFHVEHILAQQHISDDSIFNLALACPDCNRHKGPNLTTIDPGTRELIRIFNPRTDVWAEHFQLQGAAIVGRTQIGIATVRLLKMNTVERLKMRLKLLSIGEL
jgi:hypothetical protein